MLLWLKANVGTILISAALIAVVAAIIARLVINRRNGRSSCSCGCSACSMKEICHEKGQQEQKDRSDRA